MEVGVCVAVEVCVAVAVGSGVFVFIEGTTDFGKVLGLTSHSHAA